MAGTFNSRSLTTYPTAALRMGIHIVVGLCTSPWLTSQCQATTLEQRAIIGLAWGDCRAHTFLGIVEQGCECALLVSRTL